MQHFKSIDEVQLRDVWLTIGTFDGVHRGHQKIINELTAGAQNHNVPAVVLTFYPHPAVTLQGRSFPFCLSGPESKAKLLGDIGVDTVITHPFNAEVANTPARDFVMKLHQQLGFKQLLVGHDFALGKAREGDIPFLRDLGAELGYRVRKIEPLKLGGELVSSTRIRFLLGAGQVDQAANLLGRHYSVTGEVVVGDKRGRTIGFPTANLAIWRERAIPTAGVYVCWASVGGFTHQAVTNIGVRPTFETEPVPPRVEAHLLDFDQDIYGESMSLEFICRIRGERRFPSVDALINQIQEDVGQARKVFSNTLSKS